MFTQAQERAAEEVVKTTGAVADAVADAVHEMTDGYKAMSVMHALVALFPRVEKALMRIDNNQIDALPELMVISAAMCGLVEGYGQAVDSPDDAAKAGNAMADAIHAAADAIVGAK